MGLTGGRWGARVEQIEDGENMRTIATEEITRNIKEMCIEANHFLSADMEQAMKRGADGRVAAGETDSGTAAG